MSVNNTWSSFYFKQHFIYHLFKIYPEKNNVHVLIFFWPLPLLEEIDTTAFKVIQNLPLKEQCPGAQGTQFRAHFLLFQEFRRRKSTGIALEFLFLVSQKFVIYKILNTLKLFWFTIDSSVLLNEGVQFFFHDICHFFICIADCIKLYKRII